jgi:hypothetical protein
MTKENNGVNISTKYFCTFTIIMGVVVDGENWAVDISTGKVVVVVTVVVKIIGEVVDDFIGSCVVTF